MLPNAVGGLVTLPEPKLSRQEAESLALSSTWLGEPKVDASRLRYVDRGAAGMRLMWRIYLHGQGDDPTRPMYVEYWFDAITGEPG